MASNISEVRYSACWTEVDGIYWCGHYHETIGDAMRCIIPDGRYFLRAWEKGTLRSLNDAEIIIFMGEQWRVPKVKV